MKTNKKKIKVGGCRLQQIEEEERKGMTEKGAKLCHHLACFRFLLFPSLEPPDSRGKMVKVTDTKWKQFSGNQISNYFYSYVIIEILLSISFKIDHYIFCIFGSFAAKTADF